MMSRRLFTTSTRSLQQQTPLKIKNSRIAASVILTRAPQITRDATPFEMAYFDYKEKQERAAASVFPQEFYFKKGTLAERRWKEQVEARNAAMNDPSLSLTDAVDQTRASEDADGAAAAAAPVVQADRITKADKENDIKKLDRALQQNLYLIVKQQNKWQFPQTDMQASEYLHEAAERHLKEACGPDMDVWFVGRQPITHYKESPSRKEDTEGLKVFFMKARIYAGQVKPSKDVSDFAWLTKKELVDYLPSEYYNSIKDSLSDL
ncbi:hypothetical protein DM01DRAFT_1327704 [Hesseltinella vesiculosa]|uniref:Large ribosomal subunit protein mL46 n=1 Tax=Hesseltinella vesiculosa TaxID=101127 RepID=A0A1X2G6T7_9FUNG|nr:hypothetical protein DM01DRAFT_1327704 [Hesseltinella vesiculosa]